MLDQKLDPYFPMEFRWLGYIMVLAGAFYIFQGHWIWAPIIIIGGIALGWVLKGTRIDFQEQKIQEYVGMWGIKVGSWEKIPPLEKITITKTNYSQILGSRGSTSQFSSTVYRAFLRDPRDLRIPFVSDSKLEKVLAAARLVANKLDLPILDCTINKPVWIT